MIVKINGTAVTTLRNSVAIMQAINSRATAVFETNIATQIKVDDKVEILEGANVLFGGLVDSVKQVTSYGDTYQTIDCVDYTKLLDNIYYSKAHTIPSSVYALLFGVGLTHLVPNGLTISVSTEFLNSTVKNSIFDSMTLTELFNTIADNYGGIWWFENKTLKFNKYGLGTFNFNNWYQADVLKDSIFVQRENAQYRNNQYLISVPTDSIQAITYEYTTGSEVSNIVLPYAVSALLFVRLGSTEYTIAERETGANADFVYSKGERIIEARVPTPAGSYSIVYMPQYTPMFQYKDLAKISAKASQTGSAGEFFRSTSTSVGFDEIETVAQDLITQYSKETTRIIFSVEKTGAELIKLYDKQFFKDFSYIDALTPFSVNQINKSYMDNVWQVEIIASDGADIKNWAERLFPVKREMQNNSFAQRIETYTITNADVFNTLVPSNTLYPGAALYPDYQAEEVLYIHAVSGSTILDSLPLVYHNITATKMILYAYIDLEYFNGTQWAFGTKNNIVHTLANTTKNNLEKVALTLIINKGV